MGGCFLQHECLLSLSIREHAFPGKPDTVLAALKEKDQDQPAHLGLEPMCFSRRCYYLDDGLFLTFWKELCSGAFWLIYHLSQGCYGQAVLCH